MRRPGNFFSFSLFLSFSNSFSLSLPFSLSFPHSSKSLSGLERLAPYTPVTKPHTLPIMLCQGEEDLKEVKGQAGESWWKERKEEV